MIRTGTISELEQGNENPNHYCLQSIKVKTIYSLLFFSFFQKKKKRKKRLTFSHISEYVTAPTFYLCQTNIHGWVGIWGWERFENVRSPESNRIKIIENNDFENSEGKLAIKLEYYIMIYGRKWKRGFSILVERGIGIIFRNEQQ